MDSKQELYLCLGYMAYAMALSDGKVQSEEIVQFKKNVTEGVKKFDPNFDISNIIFSIIEKDKISAQTAYDLGIITLKKGSNRITDEIKEFMLCIIKEIATAYPPITSEENQIIIQFEKDLNQIQDGLTY